MPEISIATEFGHYRITFETDEDLDDALATMRHHIDTVCASTRDLRPRGASQPKPGLEHVYRFTATGRVELFTFPQQMLRAVVLALYAYHPEMVTHSELETVTSIPNVYSRVLTQTNNERYFRTQDDLFGLSRDGVAYFEEKVLPDLHPAAPDSAGSEE